MSEFINAIESAYQDFYSTAFHHLRKVGRSEYEGNNPDSVDELCPHQLNGQAADIAGMRQMMFVFDQLFQHFAQQQVGCNDDESRQKPDANISAS